MIGICKKHELIWSNNPFVLSRVEGRFFPLVSLSSSFDKLRMNGYSFVRQRIKLQFNQIRIYKS